MALAFLGLLLVLMAMGAVQQGQTKAVFSAFDKDQSGLLERGEISSSDAPLHRVMNVDGIEGISKEEFSVKGKFSWKFVNPDSYTVDVQKDGALVQHSKTTNRYRPEDALRYRSHIVEFDLSDSDLPRISEWIRGDGTKRSPTLFDNGSSYWVEDATQPVHVMGRNRAVFLKSQ